MIFCVSYRRNPPKRTRPPYSATEYSPAPMAVVAGRNHVPTEPQLVRLVRWCLTSLFSTKIWLYQRRKVRGGELSLPSIRSQRYINLNLGHLFVQQPSKKRQGIARPEETTYLQHRKPVKTHGRSTEC